MAKGTTNFTLFQPQSNTLNHRTKSIIFDEAPAKHSISTDKHYTSQIYEGNPSLNKTLDSLRPSKPLAPKFSPEKLSTAAKRRIAKQDQWAKLVLFDTYKFYKEQDTKTQERKA